MSRFKLELCSCVVKENYGELVEKVAMFIAKNGPSQLKTIIKRAEFNVKQASAVFAGYNNNNNWLLEHSDFRKINCTVLLTVRTHDR